MYNSGSDNTCCCSTSGHHLKTVTDEICNSCERLQEKPIISDARQLRSIIRNAFDKLPILPENAEVMAILKGGLKW